MTQSPAHEPVVLLDRLTPRERQVLDLVARGKTNGEIASELGISFPTAKHHVSNILSKLGTESRIEAGAWWLAHRYDAKRVESPGWRRGLARLPWLRIGTGAGIAGAVVTTVVLGVVAMAVLVGRDDEPRPADEEPLPTEPTALPSATPVPSASATPDPSPAPIRTVTGLDPEPRERPPDTTRTLGPRPESPFAPWDGTSTVIYDVESGTEQNLGPGSIAWFSPDGTKVAWIAYPEDSPPDSFGSVGEAWVLDLESDARLSLGPGVVARFEDDERVHILLSSGDSAERVDLRTGEREATEVGDGVFSSAMHHPYGPSASDEHVLDVRLILEASPRPGGTRIYWLRDRSTGVLVLQFEAHNASLAGPNELVVSTVASEDGRMNIYVVDIASGVADFVGSGTISDTDSESLPITASHEYVLWTDRYCSFGEETMWAFDRRSGELATIDISSVAEEHRHNLLWVDVVTPRALIGFGSFGAQTLIDPETLEYVAVLPEGFGDVHWSPDYRYASVGQFGGHGGRCA